MEALANNPVITRLINPAEQFPLLLGSIGSLALATQNLISTAIANYCAEYGDRDLIEQWHGCMLSNGAFYLAPPDNGSAYKMYCADNGYHGTMSADAAGIVANLVAFDQIATYTGARSHHRLLNGLREWAGAHPESAAIMAATS